MTRTAKTTVVVTAAAALMLGMSVRAEESKDAKAEPSDKHPAAEAIFQKMDANSDGFVSKEEFLAFHEARAKESNHQGPPKEMLEKRFAALDTDKDGKVSKEEFLARQPKWGHGKHGADAGAGAPPPPPAPGAGASVPPPPPAPEKK